MISPEEYASYQAKNAELIKNMLEGMGCRPVLFLGSGITRRYVSGPSWVELLRLVAERAGIDSGHFAFLSQKAGGDPIKLGSLLSDVVHEWAWTAGKNHFPQEYFAANTEKDVFLKHLACELLDGLKQLGNVTDQSARAEIDLLKKIAPHAVITTNFDRLLNDIYSEYELVVGEKIIPFSMNITGELYKIHGSTERPSSLVLTGRDYDRFAQKRRYISSKMMTFFAEYPVFIFGYGLGDKNVNTIISDLGEALKDKGGQVDNVFYVEWVPDVSVLSSLKYEHAVPVGDGSASTPLRVRTIVTSDLRWILEAISDSVAAVPVQTRVLRQLASRVVDIVRSDAAKGAVEINYQHIEQLTEKPSELARVLGIGNVANPNLEYPYLLSQVAKILGYSSWNGPQKLLVAARELRGIDIKGSDNEYHWGFKSGQNTVTHKYSEKCVALLRELKSELVKKSQDQPGTVDEAVVAEDAAV